MGRESGSDPTGRSSLGRESGSGPTGRSSLAAKVGPARPAGLHWAAKVDPVRPAGLYSAAKVDPVRPVGPPIILTGLFLEFLLLLNYLSCRNWVNSGSMFLINFSETLGSG